ncbi:MAG TPA: acyl carrier protein [Candidatus Babeliaceae bacterium]|nr:acyl carrier protein [Candidatus Babeliaceae bacterium]
MVILQDIRNTVISLIADQLSIPKESIKEQDSLEKLGADSLDRAELIMKFEETFDIAMDDEHADALVTVGQFIDYVKSLRK